MKRRGLIRGGNDTTGVKFLKLRIRRLERKAGKQEAQPCCTCECLHDHEPDPTLILGYRCICCKWCGCRNHA